jgi:DamX protein
MASTILSTECMDNLGLHRQPFASHAEPAFIYADNTLDMTFNVLLQHVSAADRPVLLEAEAQTGKSIMLYRLQQATAGEIAWLHIKARPDTSLAAIEYALRNQWPVPQVRNPETLPIEDYVCVLMQHQEQPLGIMIDDANQLVTPVLAALTSLLSTVESRCGKMPALVLAAEQTIEPKLAELHSLSALINRILTVRLRTFTPQQTRDYIHHRLRAAGLNDADLPSEDDIRPIHQKTGGLAGAINPLITQFLEDRYGEGTSNAGSKLGRWVVPAALVLIIIGLGTSITALVRALRNTGQEGATVASTTLELPKPRTEAPKPPPAPDATTAPATPAPQTGTVSPKPPQPTSQPTVMPAAKPPAAVAAQPPVAAETTPPPQPAPKPRPKPAVVPSPKPVETLHDSTWLLKQPSDQYMLQLVGVSDGTRLKVFVKEHPASLPLAWYEGTHRGEPWFVLLAGPFKTREAAHEAVADLPETYRKLGPWVRSLESVQKSIKRQSAH